MLPLLNEAQKMNRYAPWLLMFALLACGQPSHAELQLDSSKKPTQVEATLKPLFESVVRPYGDHHSADFGGKYGKQGTFPYYEDSNFAWIFHGISLLSNIASFVPEFVPLEDCKPPADYPFPKSYCDWRRERFNVCHLFMFNRRDLKLESVTRLNIARDKKQLLGLPMCLNVQAMAVAKTLPDAMLVTLGYIDSAEPSDKNYDPPEFYTTLLLRFRDENGKLKIEQDDSCLGNPNKYKTIAAARTALAKCTGAP
jgi:hypothetical protein